MVGRPFCLHGSMGVCGAWRYVRHAAMQTGALKPSPTEVRLRRSSSGLGLPCFNARLHYASRPVAPAPPPKAVSVSGFATHGRSCLLALTDAPCNNSALVGRGFPEPPPTLLGLWLALTDAPVFFITLAAVYFTSYGRGGGSRAVLRMGPQLPTLVSVGGPRCPSSSPLLAMLAPPPRWSGAMESGVPRCARGFFVGYRQQVFKGARGLSAPRAFSLGRSSALGVASQGLLSSPLGCRALCYRTPEAFRPQRPRYARPQPPFRLAVVRTLLRSFKIERQNLSCYPLSHD